MTSFHTYQMKTRPLQILQQRYVYKSVWTLDKNATVTESDFHDWSFVKQKRHVMAPLWKWYRRAAFHSESRWAAIGSASGQFSFSTSVRRQWTMPSVTAWPAQQHQGHFLLHISESVAVSLSPFTVTKGSMTGRNKVSNSRTHPGALLTWLSLALNFVHICRRYWKQIWLMKLMITSLNVFLSLFLTQKCQKHNMNTLYC